MAKLLRKRKQFGRCQVQGHGDNFYCEVCEDIQTTPFTRAQDKREGQKEIEIELLERVKSHIIYHTFKSLEDETLLDDIYKRIAGLKADKNKCVD